MLWVMSTLRKYGLWGFTDLWVLQPFYLGTGYVDTKKYGFSQVMGYHMYGLGQV